MLEAAADGLAVDGHKRASGGGGQRVDPGGEAGLERLRIQACKHAAEGVVGGDARGQLEEAGKPREFGAAKKRHLDPAIGPADDRTNGDHQHVGEPMHAVFGPRIRKVCKKAQDSASRLAFHAAAPFDRSTSKPTGPGKLHDRHHPMPPPLAQANAIQNIHAIALGGEACSTKVGGIMLRGGVFVAREWIAGGWRSSIGG
jgi:hypothetical protein